MFIFELSSESATIEGLICPFYLYLWVCLSVVLIVWVCLLCVASVLFPSLSASFSFSISLIIIVLLFLLITLCLLISHHPYNCHHLHLGGQPAFDAYWLVAWVNEWLIIGSDSGNVCIMVYAYCVFIILCAHTHAHTYTRTQTDSRKQTHTHRLT